MTKLNGLLKIEQFGSMIVNQHTRKWTCKMFDLQYIQLREGKY